MIVDAELWAPYHGENPNPSVANLPVYHPVPGNVVSCFRELCKLCVLLNDLMQNIYSSEAGARRDHEDDSAECKAACDRPFARISKDIQTWWTSTSIPLRISLDPLPQLAPPVHIVSLNLLYYTTIILIHRPVLLGGTDIASPATQTAYRTCVEATLAIYQILELQAHTFGLAQVSYLNAYSAYMAATIAVFRFDHEFNPSRDQVAVMNDIGLSSLLDVLGRASQTMPALARSNAIIQKRLSAVLEKHATGPSTLYHDVINATPFNLPTAQQLNLAEISTLQAISNPNIMQQYQFGSPTTGFEMPPAVPARWQNRARGNSYPGDQLVTDDFLPAFPTAQFPIGGSFNFGTDIADAQSRATLMGSYLDPHPRIKPEEGNINWNMMNGLG
jgi:hypothetical protein